MASATAAIASLNGARVAALPWSAAALEIGVMPFDDPQHGIAFDNTPVKRVHVVQNGDTLRVGSLVVRATATPGHTPGSTTWSWQSCDGSKCVDVVYADSQSAISADGFRFTAQRGLAEAVERGRRIARDAVAGQNLPGLSVAVGTGGAIVWAEGFGWADVEDRAPVTPDTRFRIGTASTVLTSAAAGLLVEQGRLKLDEPIQTYVPEFPTKPWPVTLRQVMAHTAGLGSDGGHCGTV